MPSPSATYSNRYGPFTIFRDSTAFGIGNWEATLICVYEKPMKYMYARTYFMEGY